MGRRTVRGERGKSKKGEGRKQKGGGRRQEGARKKDVEGEERKRSRKESSEKAVRRR